MFMKSFSAQIYALMRIVIGLLFLCHGTQKLFAFPSALSFEVMATAYWMAHGMKAFFPIDNGGELAVIYCFVFLFISAYGSGIWSIDSALE